MKFITNVDTRKLFSDSSAKSVQFLRWNVIQKVRGGVCIAEWVSDTRVDMILIILKQKIIAYL